MPSASVGQAHHNMIMAAVQGTLGVGKLCTNTPACVEGLVCVQIPEDSVFKRCRVSGLALCAPSASHPGCFRKCCCCQSEIMLLPRSAWHFASDTRGGLMMQMPDGQLGCKNHIECVSGLCYPNSDSYKPTHICLPARDCQSDSDCDSKRICTKTAPDNFRKRCRVRHSVWQCSQCMRCCLGVLAPATSTK